MARSPREAPSIRFADLDGLRAFSMLLGLVYHALFTFTADTEGSFCHDSRSGSWADLAASIPHGFRVEVFFLMAGFFARLVMVRAGPRGFVANRLRRLLRPLLIAGALLVLLMNALLRYSSWLSSGPAGAPEWLPMPFYLWFLDYLIVLEAVALVLVSLVRLTPGLQAVVESAARRVDRAFAALIALPLAPLLMAIPGAIIALQMGDPPYFSYVPHPSWLAYEGLFFLGGWLLHRQPELRLQLAARAGWLLLLGALVFAGRLWAGPRVTDALGAYLGALYAWSMALGLVGLFARYLAKPHPAIRYLADASYWTYLTHWPLLTFLQLSIAAAPLPGPLKVLALIAATLGLCLLSYQYAVRYTALGTALHGRRERAPSASDSVLVAQPSAGSTR